MEFDNSRPIYLQLVDWLEHAIACGEFTPGEKLPSVREFSAHFQVNPNTMQKALSQLEARGLIYTKRASGKYVAQIPDEIQQLKMNQARQAAKACIEAMNSLGFSKEEIQALFRECLEKNDQK